MNIIRKVHPTDINLLKHIYGMICSLGKIEYRDLSFDTFLECRDSVFIYIDKCYEFSEYPVIDGFIACRQVVDDLKLTEGITLYRRPNTVMYIIEAIHVIECSSLKKYKKIMSELIESAINNKNDAPVITYVSSNSKYISDTDLVSTLEKCGFIEGSCYNCVFTFVRPPKTCVNKSN